MRTHYETYSVTDARRGNGMTSHMITIAIGRLFAPVAIEAIWRMAGSYGVKVELNELYRGWFDFLYGINVVGDGYNVKHFFFAFNEFVRLNHRPSYIRWTEPVPGKEKIVIPAGTIIRSESGAAFETVNEEIIPRLSLIGWLLRCLCFRLNKPRNCWVMAIPARHDSQKK